MILIIMIKNLYFVKVLHNLYDEKSVHSFIGLDVNHDENLMRLLRNMNLIQWKILLFLYNLGH